jgi:hypothetical protein
MREEGGREVDHLLDEKDFFKKRLRKGHKAVFSTHAYLLILPIVIFINNFSSDWQETRESGFYLLKNGCKLSDGRCERRACLGGILTIFQGFF